MEQGVEVMKDPQSYLSVFNQTQKLRLAVRWRPKEVEQSEVGDVFVFQYPDSTPLSGYSGGVTRWVL